MELSPEVLDAVGELLRLRPLIFRLQSARVVHFDDDVQWIVPRDSVIPRGALVAGVLVVHGDVDAPTIALRQPTARARLGTANQQDQNDTSDASGSDDAGQATEPGRNG